MSTIPHAEPCRFITIEEIKERMKNDNFSYKQVRIFGKIKQLQDQKTGLCVFSSIVEAKDYNPEKHEILVDTFNCRFRQLEVGKKYEFLGEID